jgi:phenylpropionate dioxygenase-like ring-hydroxylating dioxygenase large terminal subunit
MSAPAEVVSQRSPGAEVSAGVTRAWYRDAAFLAAEQERVFAASWLIAASREDLATPGDYLTVTLAGEPIVLVRDESGTARAYRNVCRHRGLLLLEGSGHVEKRITCPYHDWTYQLDGRLERIPQRSSQFAGIDAACWGLIEVPLYDWHGLLFVNPDGRSAAFPERAGPLVRMMDPILSGPLVHLVTIRHQVRANWKILLENHLDFYHLWYLHRDSLGRYRHAEVQRKQLGDHFWSLAPLIDPSTAPRDLDWATEEERAGIGAHLLFPNLGVVTTGSYVLTYDALPVGPDETTFTLRLRGLEGAPTETYLEEIHAFLDQDMKICERLQAGLASSSWGLGPLSHDHERPVVEFQAAVARHLAPDQA